MSMRHPLAHNQPVDPEHDNTTYPHREEKSTLIQIPILFILLEGAISQSHAYVHMKTDRNGDGAEISMRQARASPLLS